MVRMYIGCGQELYRGVVRSYIGQELYYILRTIVTL